MSDTRFLLFTQLKDKVPNDSLTQLKESLDKSSEENLEKLVFLKLKNPLLALVLSIILPGIDRIYKGDLGLGILKIIITLVAIVLGANDSEELLIIAIFVMIIYYVWWIADMFLVFKGVKKDNLLKIFQILNS
ncbi:hypothetical protein DMB92_05075 [Campylobacter sp. MIT 99-7217]|uniref:hypothetical protein n=1 Tax=Campylobacter sp. MIT 99-7217 TaxID=535091 RepID=UPI00115846AF|nr:hypothetical protein [Campylobacter sp. MIT 99-7217]TQR32471.1 hypothetical protein DMB92_05075 [Campylobacter sp. MIT 99-7217]